MKILFISHNVTRTGAPLVLLYLLKWLRKFHPEITIDLFTLDGGSLESEFKSILNNYFRITVLNRKTFIERLFRKKNNKYLILDKISKIRYDIIYANSVVSLNAACEIKSRFTTSPKLICHVHELETIINILAGKFEEQCNEVDHFIAVSESVFDLLNSKYQINSSKISVIYEFSGLIQKELSIIKRNDDNFIVGGAGTGHWRKGTDIFILVAYYVLKHFPNKKIIFKWVGSLLYPDNLILMADIQKLGISSFIEFIGEAEEPEQYFKEFDIFLLTSREDPFPLVAIEVAQLGKPIICFSGATGTEEILINGGGKIVPYLDIEEMSLAIMGYFENSKWREEDGKIVQKSFQSFNPELICPEIFSVINQVLKKY